MTHKIKVGLTGGIGSGKSVVARILSSIGIPVYDSDSQAKRLTVEDSIIREKLTCLLGPTIYENNSLNKQELATFLFASEANTQMINGIIHPRVKSDFASWVEMQDKQIVAIESAILIEAGFSSDVDFIVAVYAPKEVRIQRTMDRDSLSREDVESRLSSQLDDEDKKKLADFVVVNDGVEPLIPQIDTLLRALNKEVHKD